MKNSKKIGLSFIGLLIVLLALPFFIPMDTYLRQAETMASDALGVPVKLSKARLYFLPTPRVSVSDITIGKASDVITAAKLVITPTLGTLFSEQRVIDVHLEQVVLTQSALAVYERLSNDKNDDAPSPVVLRSLSVKGLSLDFPDAELPVSNVYVALKDNSLETVKVDSVDGKIKALLTPKGAGHHIMLRVKRWELPIETKLMLDSGEFDMMLEGSQLNVANFTMSMYGGEVTGKAILSWAKTWQSSGDFTVKHLSLNKPSRMVSPSTYISGSLDGNGHFSAKAKDAGKLADHLLANFQFTVKNGVLHGLDLIKAASLIIKQDAAGGETQFDQLSGKFNISGKQYKLSNFDVRSGLLAANGHVMVSPKKALNGVVEVELKKSVGLVAVPLAVSGTVDHPLVYPTKAALAGAAIGTAVLGPGVGTSLGIKASKSLDKIKGLFGGDEK